MEVSGDGGMPGGHREEQQRTQEIEDAGVFECGEFRASMSHFPERS